MELVSYFLRFIYRIKWWLILIPLVVTLFMIYKTRDLPRSYDVKTTIYTGVMSGYNISSDGSVQNINVVNNTIDNLINLITAKSTLRQVSMRLFAQHMMYGDLNKDNNYIQAKNFQHLLSITPKEVQSLIDKSSEEKTLQKLFEYADANTDNFLYGLFHWAPPYYSYDALSKIIVRRLGSSDMLEISYTTNDPGITYQTLLLLNEEFMKQYTNLQFGETDKVIRFFENELSKTGEKLKIFEDSLTHYNIQKRIINYDEQTSNLTALNRDFELNMETILLEYSSSEALVKELEKRIGENAHIIRNNSIFMNKLNEISELSSQIAQYETFTGKKDVSEQKALNAYREKLTEKENEFRDFSDLYNLQKHSVEGYPNIDLIGQWLAAVLRFEESKAKLKVMDRWQSDLDKEYVYYSPIGSTIKRKEREIDFTEASYLAVLSSLNTARLRQKSLQMSSATLKVLNPPTFPLNSAPTQRKLKVMAAFIGSFIFVFGYFLLIELFDRTLRNKMRTERLTSGKVIGAFPAKNRLRHRGHSQTVNEIAAKSLGNTLLGYLNRDHELIINLISIEHGEGKSFVASQLASYFSSIGLNVRTFSWHSDFTPMSREYLFAQKLEDFTEKNGELVTLVEYPPLKESAIPQSVLLQANVNLVILRSTRAWKEIDKVLFSQLKDQAQNSPLYLILNQTKKEETEYFTGLLPPYTRIRKFIYRMSQLGLTSVD